MILSSEAHPHEGDALETNVLKCSSLTEVAHLAEPTPMQMLLAYHRETVKNMPADIMHQRLITAKLA